MKTLDIHQPSFRLSKLTDLPKPNFLTLSQTLPVQCESMVPAVYLAGKISKNDWRHTLVPNLRGHLWLGGAIRTEYFTYVGPFFVSCDHGCGHFPGNHGMVQSCTKPHYTRKDVINLNMAALAKADLVFAYITSLDCYGTLGEIAWAIKAGKRVVMLFAPGINYDEFWFWSSQCAATHLMVNQCCLKNHLAEELQQTKHVLYCVNGV